MAKMKATIKAVAIDRFFEKGYFATSISEIANGCGIQKASLYHHFSSKEALLHSIMQTTMEDLMAFLLKNIETQADIENQMRASVRSHVRFHLQRQKETFIANSELRGLSKEHYRTIVVQRDAYEQVFQRLLSAGMQQQVFVRGDVKILSYAILTLCTAGASWYNAGGRLNANAIAAIYEDFVLNGLKAGWQPVVQDDLNPKTDRKA